jgi:hypothetical protein
MISSGGTLCCPQVVEQDEQVRVAVERRDEDGDGRRK